MQPLELFPQAKESFRLSKQCLVSVPILAHFDPDLLIRVEMDASIDGISGILSQVAPRASGKNVYLENGGIRVEEAGCRRTYSGTLAPLSGRCKT